MLLYTSTQGQNWLNNSNWGSGEPCIDSWFGVTCCPVTHKRLSGDGTQCLGEGSVNGSAAVPPPEPSSCHSNSFTGLPELDTARCVVVRLNLPNNNLTGPLVPNVLSLPDLQAVDVRGNNLNGSIPESIAPGIVSLDLRSNLFDYPPPAGLARDCLSGRIDCPGNPPTTCTAFGPDQVVRTGATAACVRSCLRFETSHSRSSNLSSSILFAPC